MKKIILGLFVVFGLMVQSAVATDNNPYFQVSTRDSHTIAIKSDGTLWAWGDNSSGQLGDGTTIDKSTPTQIGTDSNWASIAAGDFHTIAIKSNGTLWAWGNNLDGQLGDFWTIEPKDIGFNLIVPNLTLKAHGGVLQFDGNSSVTLPNTINPISAITLEAWIYPRASTDWREVIMKNIDNQTGMASDVKYALRLANNIPMIHITTNTSSFSCQAPSALPLNEWNHISGTYSQTNTTLKLYVNAQEVCTMTATGTIDATNTIPLYLGFNGNDRWYDGTLDEVRIWNINRTASEIELFMNTQLDGNESGLVAYYNFDERTGSVVKDISGNSHDGTIVGDVTRLNFLGDSLHFDGVDDRVYQQVLDELNSSAELTLSGWINTATSVTDANYRNIIRNGHLGGILRIHNGNLDFEYSPDNYEGTSLYTLSTPITDTQFLNQWKYVTATFQNDGNYSIAKIYIDGVLHNSVSWAAHNLPNMPSNNLFTIGSYNASEYFHGDIAEVSVWSKALSLSQIQKLMHSAPNIIDANLVGYYPLNDGVGTIAKDYSTFSHSGIIADANWTNTAPIIYGNTIYTDYSINSWQKVVIENNIITPNFTVIDDYISDLNSLSGLFLYSSQMGDTVFEVSDSNNSVSQIFTIKSLRNVIDTDTHGTNSDDIFINTSSSNTIDGGDGEDTLVLSFSQADYNITFDNNIYTIFYTGNTNITYIVTNVEYLNFADVQDVAITSFYISPISRQSFSQALFNQIIYSRDGTSIFGSHENNWFSNITQFDIDNNTTIASYAYPQQYENIKDMVRVGNYIIVSSDYHDYPSGNTTISLQTFNENNISTGPIATKTITYSGGNQVEAKLAYANGKLALIGGYDKDSVWLFDATNPTALIQRSQVSLSSRYPTKVAIDNTGNVLAVASYGDIHLYSIGSNMLTLSSVIPNLTDGSDVNIALANNKLYTFIEQYTGDDGLVQDFQVYDINNSSTPILDISQTSFLTGTMVNVATSVDDNWVFLAYRHDSSQETQTTFIAMPTNGLTSQSYSSLLIDYYISDITASPVGGTIAVTDDNLGVYSFSDYNVTQAQTIYLNLNLEDVNLSENNISKINIIGVDGNEENLTMPIENIANGDNNFSAPIYNPDHNFTFRFDINNSGVMTSYYYNFIDNSLDEQKFYDANQTNYKVTLTDTNNTFNISSMYKINHAPILAQETNITKTEDFSDFNITIVAVDAENDTLTYAVESNNTALVTLSLNNNILTISPVANANGVVRID